MSFYRFEWQKPPQIWVDNTGRWLYALQWAVINSLNAMSGRIEAWMQETAPWQDITGEARRNLMCDLTARLHQFVMLTLSHGVWYGIHLELKNAGAYAIIGPALDYWAPRVMDQVREVMRR